MNAKKQQCTFCMNMQIAGPHDHIVRDFTKKNSPVTCPILLATECAYCRELGHTKNFCIKLKDKKQMSNQVFHKSVGVSPTNKRVYVIDEDGFAQIPLPKHISKQSRIDGINKIQTTRKLMNAFAALDMQDDHSDHLNHSDDDTDDNDVNKGLTNDVLKKQLGI